jgi:hypothetical protein
VRLSSSSHFIFAKHKAPAYVPTTVQSAVLGLPEFQYDLSDWSWIPECYAIGVFCKHTVPAAELCNLQLLRSEESLFQRGSWYGYQNTFRAVSAISSVVNFVGLVCGILLLHS